MLNINFIRLHHSFTTCRGGEASRIFNILDHMLNVLEQFSFEFLLQKYFMVFRFNVPFHANHLNDIKSLLKKCRYRGGGEAT